MSDILYLYGFVSHAAELPPGLSGIHGARVELLETDGVYAAYSLLPADEFSASSVDAHMQELNWVGARGLEHERVVAWFVDHAEILPASLFALYSSERALREDAAARAPHIRSELERLRGLREWDLKVSYDHQLLARNAASVIESVREIDAAIAVAAEGRRFLLERKRADMLKRELSSAARAQARQLLDRCAVHATTALALPIPRAAELPVVLSAALLVPRSAEAELRALVARESAPLAEAGIDVQLTGPWAPYRFMESPDDPAS